MSQKWGQVHFEHVERTFKVPDWENRADVPAWLREIALVVSLHGMHWTGYVFNDFARMRAILEWIATRIQPRRVLVFLPAWDGRYYWNYPLYHADARLGGEAGLRTLVKNGKALGYHFMPMFGANAANSRLEMFSKVADATMSQIDGDAFNLNWVDWDNDRHMEGWGAYMNVGVDSWRDWLAGRISGVHRTLRRGFVFPGHCGWLGKQHQGRHARRNKKTSCADRREACRRLGLRRDAL